MLHNQYNYEGMGKSAEPGLGPERSKALAVMLYGWSNFTAGISESDGNIDQRGLRRRVFVGV
jgi:hypothetical protein